MNAKQLSREECESLCKAITDHLVSNLTRFVAIFIDENCVAAYFRDFTTFKTGELILERVRDCQISDALLEHYFLATQEFSLSVNTFKQSPDGRFYLSRKPVQTDEAISITADIVHFKIASANAADLCKAFKLNLP